MKVKIKQASLKTFWYAKYLHHTFEVEISKIPYAPNRYFLILPNELLKSFIRFDDCFIVDEPDKLL